MPLIAAEEERRRLEEANISEEKRIQDEKVRLEQQKIRQGTPWQRR